MRNLVESLKPRIPWVVVLCVLTAGTAACAQTGRRLTPSSGHAAGTAVASPTPSASAAPPPGVSYRDDCAKIPIAIEPNCGPRVPTAQPPGGFSALPTDPGLIVQVLCSAVSDATVEKALGGRFYVYTNPVGECHFYKPYTDHASRFSVTYSEKPVGDFQEGDGDLWRPLKIGALYSGYADVSATERWYRVGSGADPRQPGTLVILYRYTKYKKGSSIISDPVPSADLDLMTACVRDIATELST